MYHMLETPTLPSTVLSTLRTSGVSQKKKNILRYAKLRMFWRGKEKFSRDSLKVRTQHSLPSFKGWGCLVCRGMLRGCLKHWAQRMGKSALVGKAVWFVVPDNIDM